MCVFSWNLMQVIAQMNVFGGKNIETNITNSGQNFTIAMYKMFK